MEQIDFIGGVHQSTKRDYVARVVEHDKAEVAEIATRFGEEYWDGPRHLGYGGYRYDGRWLPIAQAMAERYGLKSGSRVLDVGCGKGFLLYEFTQAVPGIEICGVDISEYAIEHSKEEIRDHVQVASAVELPFPDDHFDLVVSITTLHNLYNFELWAALQEIERVARGGKHITVESYRTEREKMNLLYWQLTCRTFWAPREWEWFMQQAGYTGDYGFIYFE
jgi:ubiquinone/menaquinone biosynthesis C-methylase UbiE